MTDLKEYFDQIAQIQKALREREMYRLGLERESLEKAQRRERRHEQLKAKIKALHRELVQEEIESTQRVTLLLAQADAVRREYEVLEAHTERLRQKKREYELFIASNNPELFPVTQSYSQPIFKSLGQEGMRLGSLLTSNNRSVPVPYSAQHVQQSSVPVSVSQSPPSTNQWPSHIQSGTVHSVTLASNLQKPYEEGQSSFSHFQNIPEGYSSGSQGHAVPVSNQYSGTGQMHEKPVRTHDHRVHFENIDLMTSTNSEVGLGSNSPVKYNTRNIAGTTSNYLETIQNVYHSVDLCHPTNLTVDRSGADTHTVQNYGLGHHEQQVVTDKQKIQENFEYPSSTIMKQNSYDIFEPTSRISPRHQTNNYPSSSSVSPSREVNESSQMPEKPDVEDRYPASHQVNNNAQVPDYQILSDDDEQSHEPARESLATSHTSTRNYQNDCFLPVHEEIKESQEGTYEDSEVSEEVSQSQTSLPYEKEVRSTSEMPVNLGEQQLDADQKMASVSKFQDAFVDSDDISNVNASPALQTGLEERAQESNMVKSRRNSEILQPHEDHISRRLSKESIGASVLQESSDEIKPVQLEREEAQDLTSNPQGMEYKEVVRDMGNNPSLTKEEQEEVSPVDASPVMKEETNDTGVKNSPAHETESKDLNNILQNKNSHSTETIPTPSTQSGSLQPRPHQNLDDEDSDFFDRDVPVVASRSYKSILGDIGLHGSSVVTESDSDDIEGQMSAFAIKAAPSKRPAIRPFASSIPSLRPAPPGTDTDSVDSVEAAIQAAMNKPKQEDAVSKSPTEQKDPTPVVAPAVTSEGPKEVIRPGGKPANKPKAAQPLKLDSDSEYEVSAGGNESDDDFDFYG